MTLTLYASRNNNKLGLVPKDLKQLKKLLNLNTVQHSGRNNRLPVTVSLISAGLTNLNMSNAALKQDHHQGLVYEGQNLFNKRTLISLLKPNCSDANSKRLSPHLHCLNSTKNQTDGCNPAKSPINLAKSHMVFGPQKQVWQIRGSALSVRSFSGNLNLRLGSSNKGLASKMGLCYQIAQQIHRNHHSAHKTPILKSPYNILGALVISKSHRLFIDSTELKQSLMLQENLDPRISLKQLTSVSKKRSACQKGVAKRTLRLFEISYANSTKASF